MTLRHFAFARTSVPSLLGRVRPLAVLRLVVSVVVDAVKRQSGRTDAHVGKEIGVAIPSFAYADATTTVEVKASVVRIMAASPHCSPRPIGSGLFDRARSMPVNGLAFCGDLTPETPAALCLALVERIAANTRHLTAVAAAQIHGHLRATAVRGRTVSADNGKAAESICGRQWSFCPVH